MSMKLKLKKYGLLATLLFAVGGYQEIGCAAEVEGEVLETAAQAPRTRRAARPQRTRPTQRRSTASTQRTRPTQRRQNQRSTTANRGRRMGAQPTTGASVLTGVALNAKITELENRLSQVMAQQNEAMVLTDDRGVGHYGKMMIDNPEFLAKRLALLKAHIDEAKASLALMQLGSTYAKDMLKAVTTPATVPVAEQPVATPAETLSVEAIKKGIQDRINTILKEVKEIQAQKAQLDELRDAVELEMGMEQSLTARADALKEFKAGIRNIARERARLVREIKRSLGQKSEPKAPTRKAPQRPLTDNQAADLVAAMRMELEAIEVDTTSTVDKKIADLNEIQSYVLKQLSPAQITYVNARTLLEMINSIRTELGEQEKEGLTTEQVTALQQKMAGKIDMIETGSMPRATKISQLIDLKKEIRDQLGDGDVSEALLGRINDLMGLYEKARIADIESVISAIMRNKDIPANKIQALRKYTQELGLGVNDPVLVAVNKAIAKLSKWGEGAIAERIAEYDAKLTELTENERGLPAKELNAQLKGWAEVIQGDASAIMASRQKPAVQLASLQAYTTYWNDVKEAYNTISNNNESMTALYQEVADQLEKAMQRVKTPSKKTPPLERKEQGALVAQIGAAFDQALNDLVVNTSGLDAQALGVALTTWAESVQTAERGVMRGSEKDKVATLQAFEEYWKGVKERFDVISKKDADMTQLYVDIADQFQGNVKVAQNAAIDEQIAEQISLREGFFGKNIARLVALSGNNEKQRAELNRQIDEQMQTIQVISNMKTFFLPTRIAVLQRLQELWNDNPMHNIVVGLNNDDLSSAYRDLLAKFDTEIAAVRDKYQAQEAAAAAQ